VNICKTYTDDELDNTSLDQLQMCKGTYDMGGHNFANLKNSEEPGAAFTVYQASFKADKSTTYSKVETDALLTAKANQSTTYSKVETDALLAGKQAAGTIDAKI
jgi:hypothetical protein